MVAKQGSSVSYRSWKIAGIASAGLIATLAFTFWTKRVHSPPSREATAAALSTAPPQHQPGILPLFPAGVQQRYQLDYASEIKTSADQPISAFQLLGPLKATGLVESPGVVAFQFDGRFSLASHAEAASDGGLTADEAIRRPFSFEFGADGAFRAARVAPGSPAFIGRMWTALGEYLQVVQAGAEALKRLRSDPVVGTQASYGLGSALHRLQDQDLELAREARSALTQELASATTPGDLVRALTALGNGGDPTTLDNIRAYVTSVDPRVRAAAAQALRRIPGPDADSLIAQLCADSVDDVRLDAVDAAHERAYSPALVSAISALALRESQFQIRAKCVNILAQWLPSEPTIAATLKLVAEHDPHADLRNSAKNALSKQTR